MVYAPAAALAGSSMVSVEAKSPTACPVGLSRAEGMQAPVGTIPCEILTEAEDGGVLVHERKIPALPLFEQAFGAFARGTLIQTPKGNVAIEDLLPGDLVITGAGIAAPIRWIGSCAFGPRDATRRGSMTRIMTDTFGLGRPAGFLTLGPAARILRTPVHLQSMLHTEPHLTAARDFIDGVNVIGVISPTPIRLYHLMLERHATVRASGLVCETFHPGTAISRMGTNPTSELLLSLFPQLERLSGFGSLAHPRLTDDASNAA